MKLFKIIDKIQNYGLEPSSPLSEQVSFDALEIYVYHNIYPLYCKEKLAMNSLDYGDIILFNI